MVFRILSLIVPKSLLGTRRLMSQPNWNMMEGNTQLHLWEEWLGREYAPVVIKLFLTRHKKKAVVSTTTRRIMKLRRAAVTLMLILFLKASRRAYNPGCLTRRFPLVFCSNFLVCIVFRYQVPPGLPPIAISISGIALHGISESGRRTGNIL